MAVSPFPQPALWWCCYCCSAPPVALVDGESAGAEPGGEVDGAVGDVETGHGGVFGADVAPSCAWRCVLENSNFRKIEAYDAAALLRGGYLP